MAGVVPTKRSTSGRKQWTLHDGPRSSLKRLRSQLASDGCAESQVVLAKQLLEEQCEVDVDKRENARLGVYWLMKASEQGNIEATELLKQCLKTGKGITEHNYMDVRECINMTQDEKLARKAAREMFASLSNGEDYITSEQLQKRMLEIDKGDNLQKKVEMYASSPGPSSNGELVNNYEEQTSESEEETDWSQRTDGSNEKLTEDHLVTAAVHYSHGQLPAVNRILCLRDPNLKALDHIPAIQRSVLHPLLAFKILYFKIIKFFSRIKISSFLPIAKTDVQLLFLMFLYSFVSSSNILYFLPMVLYYLTFLIMVCCTFQMLQTKREFLDFRVWSRLFITYSGGSLNAEQAEFQYIRNNLKPYGHFFLALTLNLMVYPIISDQWIPQSELTILSFCITFMTLHSFVSKGRRQQFPDLLTLFSFAINVLAKYPYETDPVVTQGWRFLDLKIPTFASYIIGNGIEFCINFRIVFYVFIPFLLIRIAARENWRGTYKFLIPHCVTLSWLQLVIINSQGATMFGLLRGTLALVGAVLFLPLVGLTTILLPALALTKWLMTSDSLYSIGIFFIITVVGLGITWLFAQSRYSQYIAFIQVFVSILAFCILLNSVVQEKSMEIHGEKRIYREITWEHYQNFCHEPAWESENIATTQHRCSKLVNLEVDWEGYVNEIKIKSISNTLKYIFDKLPNSLSQYLYCFYGDKVEHNCKNIPPLLERDCLIFYNAIKAKNKCNVDKWNVYEFEVPVRMHSGLWVKSAEIVLILKNPFKDFALKLKTNDKIKFRGILVNNPALQSDGILGGRVPHVELLEIECIACHNTKLTKVNIDVQNNVDLQNILSDLYLGIKSVLNFLFNPIVIFK